MVDIWMVEVLKEWRQEMALDRKFQGQAPQYTLVIRCPDTEYWSSSCAILAKMKVKKRSFSHFGTRLLTVSFSCTIILSEVNGTESTTAPTLPRILPFQSVVPHATLTYERKLVKVSSLSCLSRCVECHTILVFETTFELSFKVECWCPFSITLIDANSLVPQASGRGGWRYNFNLVGL